MTGAPTFIGAFAFVQQQKRWKNISLQGSSFDIALAPSTQHPAPSTQAQRGADALEVAI